MTPHMNGEEPKSVEQEEHAGPVTGDTCGNACISRGKAKTAPWSQVRGLQISLAKTKSDITTPPLIISTLAVKYLSMKRSETREKVTSHQYPTPLVYGNRDKGSSLNNLFVFSLCGGTG